MYNTDYSIKVYSKEQLVCKIEVKGNNVNFSNYTDNILQLPFGVLDTATIDDLEDFSKIDVFQEKE